MSIVQDINEIRANMAIATTHVTEDAIHRVLFGFVGFVKASRTLEDHEESVVVANLITDLQNDFTALVGERAKAAEADYVSRYGKQLRSREMGLQVARDEAAEQGDLVRASELEEMATREQDQ